MERSAHLLPREDADVSDGIPEILEAGGVRFGLAAECLSLTAEGTRIAVGAACDSGSPRLVGSHVLLAAGRRPNTDGLLRQYLPKGTDLSVFSQHELDAIANRARTSCRPPRFSLGPIAQHGTKMRGSTRSRMP